IKKFKKWLEDNEEIYIEDINKIDYQYDVSPLIYSRDATGEIVQLNPSTMLSGIYSDSAMSMVSSMMQGSAMMGAFYEEDFNNLSDYELLRGTYPSAYDEVLVVLNNKEMIPDLIVYSLGLRDTEELSELIQQVMNGEEVTIHNEQMMISYDDLLTLDFRLINATDLYKYNEKYDTYEDMNDDEKYIEELYSNAHKLKITGIAYSEGNSGVIYSKELTSKVINDAYNTEIVQKQLNNKDIDVFSNTAFDEDKKDSGLDFNDLVTIDEDLLKEAFIVNISEDDFDFDMMDEEKMQEVIMGNAKEAATAVTSGPNVTQLSSAFTAMNTMMLDKYIDVYESTEGIIKEETLSTPLPQTEENSEENNNESNIPDVKYLYLKEELLDAIASNITGENYKNALTAMASQAPEEYKEYVAMLSMLQAEDYDNLAASVKTSFYAYYKPVFESSLVEPVRNENGETVAKKILYTTQHQDIQGQRIEITIYGNPMSESKKVSTDLISSAILDETAVAYTNKSVNSIVNNYATYMVAASIGKSLMSVMEPMQDSFSELGDKFSGDIFEFDTEKFKEAFQFEMDEEELSRLMSSMIKSSSATYKNNLKNLGYQDENDPSSISFYFKDFDSKNHFMNILDEYNENVDEEYKISYTDITGLMMSSVATIIDSVTYVLIAFVSISLIVSSIMIAVITLISVMERTKEIGILRAMGASKSNVSSIFTAETFIIGFLSGSLGILVSYLALIPINMVIHNINTDITAVLEIQYAVILIAISVALTLFSGLIPSRKAAKQDPVIALRSE
ncbi:MAG: FtsX-like permease family protein, partial [Solobacterium sp.]|nr:FtsX-like permease family protein [Solobacterium sp.]